MSPHPVQQIALVGVAESDLGKAGEAFAANVPYIVVLVDLEEGVRLMSNLIDCPPEQARVGMAVEVVFEDVSPDIALYKFHPA